MKKYEMTDETIEIGETKLYRIKALKNFGTIKTGELGGYIEKESNLSHEGDCWVSNNAKVFQNAEVSDNAMVYMDAVVAGYAKIKDDTRIYDSAMVHGFAIISEKANIFNNAVIAQEGKVSGTALVRGHACILDGCVEGNSIICDCAKIIGNSNIKDMYIGSDSTIGDYGIMTSNKDLMNIHGLGSRFDTTTFYRGKENTIYVVCGCFNGTLEEFENRVELTHGDNKFGRDYKMAIKLARSFFYE